MSSWSLKSIERRGLKTGAAPACRAHSLKDLLETKASNERHVHHGKAYEPSVGSRPSGIEADGTPVVEEDLLLVAREP